MIASIFESDELTAIEQKVWALLSVGVVSYKNTFHHGCIANVQDGYPELRTVILRKVMETDKKLFFHTDIRAPKVPFLQKNPAISWLFYDEGIRLQLRMQGTANIHFKNEIAEKGWAESKLSSKLTYSIANAPGTVLAAPIPININEKEPSDELVEFAASNFAVVETSIATLDIVFLHHQGNKRAFIDYTNQTMQWVQA